MKIINARKIGFWAALAMGLDSMVGMGVYVKNYSIISNVGQQGIGILLTWIIGAVISITMLISYLEIFRIKTVKVHGMAAFAERCVGHKFGYFVRFNLPMFYMPIFQLAMGFYSSEFFFNGIGFLAQSLKAGHSPSMPPFYVHVIIGLVLVLFFQIINFYSIYSGGKISIITTLVKFTPLLVAIVGGIILWNTNTHSGKETNLKIKLYTNWFTQTDGKSLNFNGILMSSPSVLFAYDQFLSLAASKEKIEGGQKTVSKVAVIALLIVVATYILASVAQIAHGVTNIASLLTAFFPSSQYIIWQGIGRLFIGLAIIGSLNFFCHSNAVVFEQAIRSETFIGVVFLRDRISVRSISLIYYLMTLLVWWLIIMLSSLILKTDEIIDEASNMPSLFFFTIYTITLFGYAWNRDRINVKRIKNWVFWITFVVSTILLLVIIIYELIYVNVVRVLIHPDADSSVGLLEDRNILNNWKFFIIYLLMAFFFFAVPVFNALLIRHIEKRDVTKSTQDDQLQSLEWDENYQAHETQEVDFTWDD